MEQNVYKTANKSASVHTNQIRLSSNRLRHFPWSSTCAFKKIETTKTWNYISKALLFLQIEDEDCPVFFCPGFSITFSYLLLELHEHRGGYWRKTLFWKILEEEFLVPRNTAATQKGYGVISLLWQLRCHYNLDHNKCSSLSSTAVVVIFPNLC